MDRIHRRQIGARPFLRPAQFFVLRTWNSNSVQFGEGERGKRHEFINGDIHGTATGNLFFLVHGTGGISSFIIFCLFTSWSLFELGSNRDEYSWRFKHRRWSEKTVVDRSIDSKLEKRRSSFRGDFGWGNVNRGVFVWQQWPQHSFYGFHVAGGHCGLTLIILFWLSENNSIVIML